ncbi:MAG: FAD-binding oxidoreductase [Prolixibacteraceae bacterium]|jgi:D-lactate dehydrogenase|nr:FAD-binding oxidoreductase [Prolixibacteraceae bacterium]
MLTGNFQKLYDRLVLFVDKNRIYHDPLHTLALGTDASFYRLIPKMVIKAKNEAEVSLILKVSSNLKIPVTFRAAGTSLSGQAVTDSVLVIAGNNWKKSVVEENGAAIRLQPGLTGSEANALLAKYGRKIGPDPASIQAAMIGGIAANNASGMCCGTADNSYQTLLSMRIIFQDGTVLDTGNETSCILFRETHASLLNQIALLKEFVAENVPLSEKIRHKYKMKNTTGYSINALVDFSDPIDIVQHLMIGSEGTLGFIAEIRYRTVAEDPCKASSLMLFPSIYEACKAVILLQETPVAAVELIDRAGLKSVETEEGLAVDLKTLDPNVCALLVETRAAETGLLEVQIKQIARIIADIPTVLPVQFTADPLECAHLWKIRKGMFPSVGAMRKKGTTVIIEDVAFPLIRLAEATLDLQQLFEKWGYHEAVIFGHALMGNLHFVFTQDFTTEKEIERYKNFMEDVSDLVVHKYDGALKAEHGTGRNMAPFVELEWGAEAYILMKRIKAIFDPEHLLNPGVILNNDPFVHLKNLKPIPAAHEKIDTCIECGFCEPNCVAAELTLTPRQRIVAYREIASLKNSGEEPHLLAQLLKLYRYAGNETCATDGLCATTCPVKIDTGKLIKSIRQEEIGNRQKRAIRVAKRMKLVTGTMRTGLTFVAFVHKIVGTRIMSSVTKVARWLTFNKLPLWNPWMPTGAKKIHFLPLTDLSNSRQKVVYFPSCINRSMGPSGYEKGEQLTEVMQKLLHKGGFEVIYPENLSGLCCGMAFSSKGYTEAGDIKSRELEAALQKASENGRYPVLCDMSPCLYTMRENMGSRIKLYEPVEFILEHLLPQLTITPLEESIAVFPVCSLKKMGLDQKLTDLASLCAKDVVVAETNCCGFAGDRGFSFPELNQHGLRTLKAQLPKSVRLGYSNSRTCEIGLSLHSGIPFQSIVYLVDKVSSEMK